jgi:hypothetical protein
MTGGAAVLAAALVLGWTSPALADGGAAGACGGVLRWNRVVAQDGDRPSPSRRGDTGEWPVRSGPTLPCDAGEDAAPSGVDPVAKQPGDPLDPLRAHWVAAVQDEGEIERGLAEAARIRAAADPAPGSALDGALTGYVGGLEALRAHHARWPPTKLRHLRRGLATLDAAVQAHPHHLEIRYVRLMSCYFLPGILGRNWSVREDFAVLGELLPGARDAYPAAVYRTVAEFVLAHGALPAERHAALAASLAAADG